MPDTKAAYDAVATLYADTFRDILKTMPLERSVIAAFAELVQTHDAGPIADVGCGPGHITAYLNSLGPEAFGIDLSSEMVALAQKAHPDLRFEEGTMTALNLADAELGGILSNFSIIHLPPAQMPQVFAEFERVLASGGHLLLGFYAGDDREPETFDHKVSPAYRWSADRLAELLRQAGFSEVARLVREPQEGDKRQFQQIYLLMRKPVTPTT
ncbi:class I SAM-dependent methyltransferase [Lentzea alba]|uniref:class I SAM-dependent methyltransferase n=1 Tax=Lentzea alba TaxID=2714351 RepID=UPI0039BFB1B5